MNVEDLEDIPLWKWKCSDGCVHLRSVPSIKGYRCGFFDKLHVPFLSRVQVFDADLTHKRIHGPHVEGTLVDCAAFEPTVNKENHND